MAKKLKINKGQIWKHNPSGGLYEVISKSQIKIPHVGWFKAITYKDLDKGLTYSRFIEDFENKFSFLRNKL